MKTHPAMDIISELMAAANWKCLKCSNKNWTVWVPNTKKVCPSCGTKRPTK